jgi:ABC-type transport system substrate-binding protein
VHSHLKDNGIFIFDINSYYKLKEILGNNIFNFDSEDVVYIWENYLDEDIVQMNLTFFVKQGDLYRRFDEEHCERAYTEEYFEEIITTSGFKIVKKLNNYTDKAITEETERIVYVLSKIH